MGQLDRVLPWWKFHVFLYEGSRKVPGEWHDEHKAKKHLKKHKLDNLLNASIPLVLPQDLTLSAIDYTPTTVRVLAVQRRNYTARDQELDEFGETEEGETIEYRAWVRQLARVMVIFEWQLRTREATLQITELPGGVTYEETRDQFAELVKDWLDLSQFSVMRIRKSISALHAAEEAGKGEARSHGIEYSTVQGRRLAGRSSTATESVLGEQVIDESLRRMRGTGMRQDRQFLLGTTLGKWWWLADRWQRDSYDYSRRK